MAVSSDLIGIWSQKHGYETDPKIDWRVEFRSDGTCIFRDPEETVSYWWEFIDDNRLQIRNRIGPNCDLRIPARSASIKIRRETLPLGEFTVLEIDGHVFPVNGGFTKIVNQNEHPYRDLDSW